jgi:MoaA/NifB/PqqE/SkfB family radical SAM enzyme
MSGTRNLELNLGKLCNNRCIFCLDGRAPKESRRWVPADRAFAELERAREEGTTSLGLLGGEPTVHPEILRIVARARELGFERIALTSNGLRLSSPDLCRELVEAGVTRFSLSVHAHTAADEDYLTGRKGNFDRKVRGIENLVALRDEGFLPHNVSLNAVISTRIHRSMPEYASFYRRLGIGDVRFNMIRTDACPDRGEELTPRFRELTPEILRAVAFNESRLHMHMSFGDLPLCVFPWEILDNAPLAARVVGEARDLETWVAVFTAPRDLDTEADRFNWTAKKRSALKLQPGDPCGRCARSDACEGVWRSYHGLFGSAELQPLR